jgi:Fe-S cluster assembly protein SufB
MKTNQEKIAALKEVLDKKNDFSYLKDFEKGISKELIYKISQEKKEDKLLLKKRLDAFAIFQDKKVPNWGPDLSELKLEELYFYAKANGIKNSKSWDEVSPEIKETFTKLGIPQAEQRLLAGAGAQYESEAVYHKLKPEWEAAGVIFMDLEEAFKKHPQLVLPYFAKCITNKDHYFAALHGAIWSGGTFLYVPEKLKLKEPIQSYFRMNAPELTQAEHTLIILEKGAEAHYIEGCSAPKYDNNSLHVGAVEIFVKEGAKMRYSSVENWSENTYNLNTKRAILEKNAQIEWVSGNLGSKTTMLYPCSVLKGENAKASHLSLSIANKGQTQDLGAKVYHLAKNTSSRVISKNLIMNGGHSIYRGDIKISKDAVNSHVQSECDTICLDDKSKTETFPSFEAKNKLSSINHEASSGKLNPDDVFYLTSKGFNKEEAENMIINGFLNPITKELPLEYAIELNRLVELEIEKL